MTRREIAWTLFVILAGISAFAIASLYYSDVVNNSRASGLAIAAFLAAWLGGIVGICGGGSYLLTRLIMLAWDR